MNGAIPDAARFLVEHPEIDIVFADYCFVDEQGKILRYRREIPFSYPVYLWTRDC